MFSGCGSIYLYPERVHIAEPSQFGIEYQDIFISGNAVAKGSEREPTLHGWLMKAAKSNNKESKSLGLIVQFHGNAENISSHFRSVAWLTEFGYDVLAFDYRGFGKSEGQASSLDGARRDAERVLEFVIDQKSKPDSIFDSANQKLIVYGQSLGGAVAAYAASRPKLKAELSGVVLESAFSRYRSIIRDKVQSAWLFYPLAYPLSWMFSNQESPADLVAEISPVPLFIAHAELDPIVPAYHSNILFEQAQSPKQQVMVAGWRHASIFAENTDGQITEQRRLLLDFLNQQQ